MAARTSLATRSKMANSSLSRRTARRSNGEGKRFCYRPRSEIGDIGSLFFRAPFYRVGHIEEPGGNFQLRIRRCRHVDVKSDLLVLKNKTYHASVGGKILK